MLIFKTSVLFLNTLLFCFSLSANSLPEVESAVDDREIGQESLLDNNEGSGEIDVTGEKANSFVAGQLDLDPPIEEANKIEENFMNAEIQEEKVDDKEDEVNKDEEQFTNLITTEIFEDEANQDEEETKKIITAEIAEDEANKDGDSIKKIRITEVEEDDEPILDSEDSKHVHIAVEGNIDEGPVKEEGGSNVQIQETGDDGKKYSEVPLGIGRERFIDALELLADLRKDLDGMIRRRREIERGIK